MCWQDGAVAQPWKILLLNFQSMDWILFSDGWRMWLGSRGIIQNTDLAIYSGQWWPQTPCLSWQCERKWAWWAVKTEKKHEKNDLFFFFLFDIDLQKITNTRLESLDDTCSFSLFKHWKIYQNSNIFNWWTQRVNSQQMYIGYLCMLNNGPGLAPELSVMSQSVLESPVA